MYSVVRVRVNTCILLKTPAFFRSRVQNPATVNIRRFKRKFRVRKGSVIEGVKIFVISINEIYRCETSVCP